MIDIHCHLLPGLDDGARDWDQAVAMCRMAYEDGITHVVATPHANYAYEFSPEKNRQLLAELQSRAQVALKISTGCDFHLDFDNLQSLFQAPESYTVNQKSYLLIEFEPMLVLPNVDRLCYEMQSHQITPIVTHPERNLAFQKQPELLRRLVEVGAPVQVTAGSIEGRFGGRAQRFAKELLRQKMVHIIASDAHDLDSRPPVLSRAYEIIAKEFGATLAKLLFIENPQAVLAGDPLPYFPELEEQKRRWSLFSFLKRS